MDTIKKVFKNKEEMKKILFTLLIFVVFKLLTMIPAAKYVNPLFSEESSTGFIGIINSFSGDALRNMSLVALGIGPYITASIIVELLEMVIPALHEWREEGEEGRRKLSQLTRYLGIVVALIQAIATVFVMSSTIFAGGRTTFLGKMAISITLTAGAALCMWLADLITQFGVGNGASLLITMGIVISFPTSLETLFDGLISTDSVWTDYLVAGITLLCFFAIIIGIVFMESSQRKIQIQYSNRPSSAKFQGASDSTFPIKLNSASVIPVIFAGYLMGIPMTIIQYTALQSSNEAAYNWLTQIFSSSEVLGYVIYVLLIFFFAVFYTFLQINPEKTAEDLQKRGAYIPGYRPGYETEQYLTKVIFNTTLFGALYLVVVASLPTLASMLGAPSSIEVGGTSMMIVVGVAVETARQIKTDVQDQRYAGFLG